MRNFVQQGCPVVAPSSVAKHHAAAKHWCASSTCSLLQNCAHPPKLFSLHFDLQATHTYIIYTPARAHWEAVTISQTKKKKKGPNKNIFKKRLKLPSYLRVQHKRTQTSLLSMQGKNLMDWLGCQPS